MDSVAPTIDSFKQWYASQPKEQQARLNDLGVGAEVLANFIGAKAGVSGVQALGNIAPEVGSAIKTGAKAVGNVTKKGVAGVGNTATAVTEYATKTATGLNRATQDTIKNDTLLFREAKAGRITPASVTEEAVSAINKRSEDLSELGTGYQTVKQGNIVTNSTEIEKIYQNALK